MLSRKGEVANLSTWMYCLSLVFDEVTSRRPSPGVIVARSFQVAPPSDER